MTDTTVDVVIVNYNTRDRTIECIDSVAAQGIQGLSVILVDNGSSDDSAAAIRSAHPEVVVIEAGENLGFARGVNLGVEHSDADRVLLLNPDATVFPGSLEALIGFADAHPEYGVYGGRTVRGDGSVDPSSCWGAPTLWSLLCYATGLSTAFKRSPVFDPESLGRWQRDSIREVPIITGCLLMIARSDWRRLGGMDPTFFLYGEDAEFSARARRAGLRPVIVPDAVIQHDVGGSTASSGRKMAMVSAGKVTYLNLVWSKPAALAGVMMLQAGAAVRGVLELATRSKRRTWRDVWAHRRSWRRGYPMAERTLFGRIPPTPVARLSVLAEPAFRTEKANPYNGSLYRAMQRAGARVDDYTPLRLLLHGADVVHLHWPDLTFLSGHRKVVHVARLAAFYGALALRRRTGTILVWTVHNLEPHVDRSAPWVRRLTERLLLRNLDGILALTRQGLEAVRETYPSLAEVPAAVTPHGHYREAYDFDMAPAAARDLLGIDRTRPVIATVGQVRPYKNVPELIRVFRTLDPDASLLVAGKPSTAELSQEIRTTAAGDGRIHLDLRFLPDEDVAVALASADLVVLPYTRIQNSGSAILALSASRPVLVPDMGAMRELQEQIGEEWVRLFSGDLDADALAEALSWATSERTADADLSALDWDRIAASTQAAYADFLTTRARNT